MDVPEPANPANCGPYVEGCSPPWPTAAPRLSFASLLARVLRRRLEVVRCLGVLAPAGLAYVFTLPHAVQAMDTGELVACAYGGYVAHPPGYPAYLALYGAWTHLVPFGSVFWRAGLLTALLACLTLGLVAAPAVALCQRRGWAGALRPFEGVCVAVLPLAASPLFWAYAVLPDVFMLHAACAAATVHLYLRPGRGRMVGMASVFGLGMCNHHTLLFLLALPLERLWAERAATSWRRLVAGALVWGALVGGAYLALMALQPMAWHAWGQLTNPRSVLDHVLRRSYGTFRLSAHGSYGPFFGAAVGWARQLATNMPATALLAALAPFTPAQGRHLLRWVTGALAAYVLVFFAGANVAQPEVLERFYLLPNVLVAMLAHHVWSHRAACWPRWARAALVLAAVVPPLSALPATWRRQNFSGRTVVEDYARNLLAMPERQAGAIVVVGSDTLSGALAYAQVVLGDAPEVTVVNRGRLASAVYVDKLARTRPKLRRPPIGTGARDVAGAVRLLIEPSAAAYTFFLPEPVNAPRLEVTVLGLGRALRAGEGVTFDEASRRRLRCRTRPAGAEVRLASEERALFAQYGDYARKLAQVRDAATSRSTAAPRSALSPACSESTPFSAATKAQ